MKCEILLGEGKSSKEHFVREKYINLKFKVNGMASEFQVKNVQAEEARVPVHEIALRDEKEVPPEFVVSEDVLITLLPDASERYESTLLPPVIDLRPLLDGNASKDSSVERVKAEIGRACEEWGFFQVVNHGIDESLVEGVLGLVRDFFDLPLEERKTYAIAPGANQGYGRLLRPKTRSWSDAFRHRLRPRPSADQDIRPKMPTAYREITDHYGEEITKLARKLLAVLSEYLGLEADALQNALTKDWDAYPEIITTSNLYPKCPQADRVLGIYPHSDAGVMTILCDNEVDGLQVLKDGNWITVSRKKNALVVNVANQLEILTNGRLKSSKHRAVVNKSAARLSIAAFCGPGSRDLVIGPLPQFVSKVENSNCMAKYTPMTYADYLSAYFKRDMEASPLTILTQCK